MLIWILLGLGFFFIIGTAAVAFAAKDEDGTSDIVPLILCASALPIPAIGLFLSLWYTIHH